MKFLIEKDRKTKLSYLKLYFHVGSSEDPKDLEGLAFLTMRSLLWGTQKKSQKELSQAIELKGASISSAVGIDRSVVSLSVIEENFDDAFKLFQEVLFEPKFDEETINKLKELVKGEIRSQLADPKYLTSRAMMASLMKGSEYETSGEGTLESIDRITPKKMQEFFEKYLNKDNAFVTLVGTEKLISKKAMIEEALEKLPAGQRVSHSGPKVQFNGKRGLVVGKSGQSTTPMYFMLPGFLDSDPNRLELELGNFIFGGDFTSRLIQVLRAKNGWTYGASSGFGQTYGEKNPSTMFTMFTFPSAEYAELAIPKTIELLNEFVEKGMTDEEFDFAQNALANSYALKIDSAHKRLGWNLKEYLHGRKFLPLDEYQKTVRGFTKEGINETIKKRFDLSQMFIGTVGNAQKLKSCIESIEGFNNVEVVNHE